MKKLFMNANVVHFEGDVDFTTSNLLVENGRIEKIITSENDLQRYLALENLQIIDCNNQFLTPGLINCHVHIFMESHTWDRKTMFEENHTTIVLNAMRRIKALGESGVTYFRECGGFKNLDIDILNKLSDENWRLPEFITAGSALCITGGHAYWMSKQCDNEEGFITGVRENIRDGADCIKLMVTGGYARPKMRVNHNILPGTPQMTTAEIKAAVDEAHRLGKKVAAHCIGLEGVRAAVEAGIDSIEHGQFHDPSLKEVDDVIKLMVEKGTYLVPTLAAYYKEYNKDDVRRDYETVDISLKKCYDAGVKIAMGTDAGCPYVGHHQTAMELIHQLDAGMTAKDTLKSATIVAAELLGIDKDYGTIEEGKFADFVLIKDNPLKKMDTFLDIKHVYKKGEPLK